MITTVIGAMARTTLIFMLVMMIFLMIKMIMTLIIMMTMKMMKRRRLPGVEERESLAFPPRFHLPPATWSHNERVK